MNGGQSERNDAKVLPLLSALVILFLSGSFSESSPSPYAAPEKLVYDLTWTGVKAGTATLEIREEAEGVKILSTAQSASWVSVFYTVDDRVESTLLRNTGESFFQPSRYRLKIREGRHRRDKEVVFNHEAGKAVYTDHLKREKKEYDIVSPIFDPLSGFYHMRWLDLSVGRPVYIAIFDSKKVWNVEVQVLRRETITIPQGKVNTLVVKPLMKSEGIFSRQGDIVIWLTDDSKRIPVKMQTKVVIGSITATLVSGM